MNSQEKGVPFAYSKPQFLDCMNPFDVVVGVASPWVFPLEGVAASVEDGIVPRVELVEYSSVAFGL